MTKTTKIFMDCEFTGLHKDTTLISIGCVSDTHSTFYAEFTDYDKTQVHDDDWLYNHVMRNLLFEDRDEQREETISIVDNIIHVTMKSSTQYIVGALDRWFVLFDSIEMWGDCLAYDWILFCNIFGNAFQIPKNIYYIPFDLATLMKLKGVDPDISREQFAYNEYFIEMRNQKHNALWDAKTIKICYEKLCKKRIIL